MADQYYSDQINGSRPRDEESISQAVWGGICAFVEGKIELGAFGEDFPDVCQDGNGVIGTDWSRMRLACEAEVSGVDWPLNPNVVPDVLDVLDFIEFCYEHIAAPRSVHRHGFYGHDHLAFDRVAGRAEFCTKINRIFSRNGVAYELNGVGSIERIGTELDEELVTGWVYDTSDSKLDQLLQSAVDKYRSARLEDRREAVRQLWDAFERTKTLLDSDKRRSSQQLLESITESGTLQKRLDGEMRELTLIGNQYHIRHSETSQEEIQEGRIVDYLFHRMFAFLHLAVVSLDKN